MSACDFVREVTCPANDGTHREKLNEFDCPSSLVPATVPRRGNLTIDTARAIGSVLPSRRERNLFTNVESKLTSDSVVVEFLGCNPRAILN